MKKGESGENSSLACIQAKLNYYNAKQNWLTRFFTIEYSTTFDLYLPGLQCLNVPVPLGGTSNHFRTSVLTELGGMERLLRTLQPLLERGSRDGRLQGQIGEYLLREGRLSEGRAGGRGECEGKGE